MTQLTELDHESLIESAWAVNVDSMHQIEELVFEGKWVANAGAMHQIRELYETWTTMPHLRDFLNMGSYSRRLAYEAHCALES